MRYTGRNIDKIGQTKLFFRGIRNVKKFVSRFAKIEKIDWSTYFYGCFCVM